MTMKKQDKMVVIAAVGLLSYALLLSFLGSVVSSLQTNKMLGNSGSVSAVGPLGVYWNPNGTNATTSFNWGTITPNSTKSIACYVKNQGNQTLTLSMSTSNWNPSNCTQFMTLNWNLTGSTLNPGQIKTAKFTLAASALIQGIYSFSFDVIVAGSS
jgi:hypothetical protein